MTKSRTMGEGVYIYGVIASRQVSANGVASARRIARNQAEADKLEREGYTVVRNLHKNGAYFAEIGQHHAHETEVGRIFAENGFAFTLDREGNAKVKINDRTLTLPSSDGRVEGFTHEIYKLSGEPNIQKVVDSIKHSYKLFKADRRRSIQSDIAISIAPKGSKYTKSHIREGVKEYKRQLNAGEAIARPLLYLHVNESTRSIYRWRLE